MSLTPENRHHVTVDKMQKYTAKNVVVTLQYNIIIGVHMQHSYFQQTTILGEISMRSSSSWLEIPGRNYSSTIVTPSTVSAISNNTTDITYLKYSIFHYSSVNHPGSHYTSERKYNSDNRHSRAVSSFHSRPPWMKEGRCIASMSKHVLRLSHHPCQFSCQ